MQQIDDSAKHVKVLASALKMNYLAKKVSELANLEIDEVAVLELSADELLSLKLPREYLFGKVVRLPSNFRPQQEIHFHSKQLTGVISGQLLWAQGNTNTERILLTENMAIITPVNTWHGHATESKPVSLVALFTVPNPQKDLVRDFNW